MMPKLTHHGCDGDWAQSTFADFMTVFGSAQQVLKNRMQRNTEQKLGPLHMRVLSLCGRAPGCTQQQVVQSMGRDKGQVARLARDLEEHQLIVRSQDAHDRRVWRLALTPEGEQKRQWFAAIETALATDLFGGLAPRERDQLMALLQGLRQRLDVIADDERAGQA